MSDTQDFLAQWFEIAQPLIVVTLGRAATEAICSMADNSDGSRYVKASGPFDFMSAKEMSKAP